MAKAEQARAVQRYVNEVWTKGDVGVLDELFSSNAVRHGPTLEAGAGQGAQGKKELVDLYRTAFPDLTLTLDALSGDGDTVISRWTATGTNTGEMLGNAPTGKSFEVYGFWMHRFEGDLIVEEWASWDTLGFLQQVGLAT